MKPQRRSPAHSLLTDGPDFLAETVERYEDGATLVELSAELDVGTAWLSVVLRRAGCKMRPAGPKRDEGDTS